MLGRVGEEEAVDGRGNDGRSAGKVRGIAIKMPRQVGCVLLEVRLCGTTAPALVRAAQAGSGRLPRDMVARLAGRAEL